LGINLEFQAGISLDTVGELREKSGTIAAMIDNLELMRGMIFGYKEGRIIIHPFQLNDNKKKKLGQL